MWNIREKTAKKKLEKIEELFMVHACKVAISCLFIHNGARASLKFYLIFFVLFNDFRRYFPDLLSVNYWILLNVENENATLKRLSPHCVTFWLGRQTSWCMFWSAAMFLPHCAKLARDKITISTIFFFHFWKLFYFYFFFSNYY